MSTDLIALVRLMDRIVHRRTEIVSIADEPVADWHEVTRTSPMSPLSGRQEQRLVDFVEGIKASTYHLAILSDGLTLDHHAPVRLAKRECRVLRVQRSDTELNLRQMSRLRASVLVARLQIRGMIPLDLQPAGPNRSNLEAMTTAPFW